MGGLIDLILENPLFLIILIGGIVSLLRGKSENTEENQPETKRPKPAQAENAFEPSRQRERSRSAETIKTEPVASRSIEELRQEQMLRFSGQADSDEDQQVNKSRKISNKIRKESTRSRDIRQNEKVFKNNFNQSLTKKGLVNSVIMAEVLGAPRSRRAYQTVITKRRNR